MYIKFVERVDLKYSYHTQTHTKGNCEVMDMSMSLIVTIISQCICTSRRLLVHRKHVIFIKNNKYI